MPAPASTRPPRTKNELRCFCSRRPLLAMYGIDADGMLYVHIKVYKQSRLYCDIIARGGLVEMICRECVRWHRVNVIQPDKAVLKEQSPPVEVEPPPFFVRSGDVDK